MTSRSRCRGTTRITVQPILSSVFQPVDVLGELPPIRPMVVAVVLDSQHDVLPAHIEEVPGKAVRAEHGDLGRAASGIRRRSTASRSQVSLGD